MFIGHLPAGYILSKSLSPSFEPLAIARKPFLIAGMLGAVAPDLDMLYFYFVDHRQHHHHSYWTHFPVVWASLLLLAFMGFRRARSSRLAALALIFSLNGFVHMLLDSIVGDIRWFAPFSQEAYALFEVPALYKPWWWNFLLHWSFLLEVGVVAGAVFLWVRSRSNLCGEMSEIA